MLQFAVAQRAAWDLLRLGGRGGEPCAWSVILKVLPPNPESPTGWNYPPREALAYERGLFDDLPPGLEAPRWFGHAERGGQHQVWLEDLGSDAIRWRLDDYGKAGERGQLRIRAKGDESVRGRGASRRRSYAGLPVPPSAI